jgi:hypothetical protein
MNPRWIFRLYDRSQTDIYEGCIHLTLTFWFHKWRRVPRLAERLLVSAELSPHPHNLFLWRQLYVLGFPCGCFTRSFPHQNSIQHCSFGPFRIYAPSAGKTRGWCFSLIFKSAGLVLPCLGLGVVAVFIKRKRVSRTMFEVICQKSHK